MAGDRSGVTAEWHCAKPLRSGDHHASTKTAEPAVLTIEEAGTLLRISCNSAYAAARKWRTNRTMQPGKQVGTISNRKNKRKPQVKTQEAPAEAGASSWSGRPDSNRRPSPWQGDALPAELRPHEAFTLALSHQSAN